VVPRAGLNDVEKIKFLTLLGLELRTLGRPACSHSLYRLSYPGSHRKVQNNYINQCPVRVRDVYFTCTQKALPSRATCSVKCVHKLSFCCVYSHINYEFHYCILFKNDLHFKKISCHQGMEGGDALQIWNVAANILSKQCLAGKTWRNSNSG
jgi:hypothetical protein